jgi:molecular chaperone DnaJ
MFGDIFGGRAGFGGFGARGARQQHKGNDLRLRVSLTLEEINQGITKKFKVRKDMTCSHCHGTGAEGGSERETCPTCHGAGVITHTTQSIFGMMQTQGVCPTCHGEGQIIKNKCKECGGTGITKGEEVVEVKIPAGVAEGMIVTIPGKGGAGMRGGIPGDILVMIQEEDHKTFVRDGNDLIYNLLLDFPTAALGGDVSIPTIDGKSLTVKIDSGTQPGKTMRLRGKGLPVVQGYGSGRGDLVVNISVYVPKTLSRDEKKAIEAFKDSDNFKGDSQTKESIFQRFKNYFQ